MSEVLVVANRTLGGEALLNAVRARAATSETFGYFSTKDRN